MADKVRVIQDFYGGLALGAKLGGKGSFRWGERLNIYDDPNELTIMPAPVKVSGSTVTGLVKWIVDGTPHDTNRYFYDDGGKIYKETSGGTWSSLQTTANSVGQGLALHSDYLYYTQNTQIGRYGPLSGTPAFDDDWQTGLTNTSATGFAPILAFKEGFAVGHGNKLAWWDGAVWDVDRITLPPGFNIRSLTVIDEFIVIGAWRGDSVLDSEEGYVFFWDGTSTTFAFFAPSDGAPNAMESSRNRLLSITGSSGVLYLGSSPFEKIHQIPKLELAKYLEIFPGAMTNWKGLTYIGCAGLTDSATVKHGVYSWGSKSSLFPEALNNAFSISTGSTTGTTVKIGAIKGVGDELYIGWRDGSSYGVDKVTQSNTPAASAVFETLIFDDDVLFKDKTIKAIKATHLPLRAGESISLAHKRNRSAAWSTGASTITNSTDDSTETMLPLEAGRCREFEVQLTLAQGSGTSPTVTGLFWHYDDLRKEVIF